MTQEERAREMLNKYWDKNIPVKKAALKAMLEFHKQELREELIKFLTKREYPQANQDPSLQVMIRYIVDEYLKSKI